MVDTNLVSEEEEYECALTLILLSKGEPKSTSEDEDYEDEEEVYEEEEEEESLPSPKIAPKAKKKPRKKRKVVEEDDSEETLRTLLEWNEVKPEKPPFLGEVELVGVCSEPMRKQLTESDVKKDQCRLMLSKAQVKKMRKHVMTKEESDRLVIEKGREVLVYTQDGEVHKMKFKMWNGDTPVLMSTGWRKFVEDYELKMHTVFLTIWMFRSTKTGEICFAIEFTRFEEFENKLSRRILKAVFPDPN